MRLFAKFAPRAPTGGAPRGHAFRDLMTQSREKELGARVRSWWYFREFPVFLSSLLA